MKVQMVFQRYEIKYIMTRRQQQAILGVLASHMQEDAYGHSSIRNLYLDTPDFRLIRRSLEKPVYKEKLRVRSYGRAESDAPVFVELKKKFRSVVYKRRISMAQDRALRCIAGQGAWPDSQIGNELAYATAFYPNLRPAVFLSYERDAYHGVEDETFRVTFDTEIRYRQEELTMASEPWGRCILPPDQVLMELKASGSLPFWMVRVLSGQGIFPTSFSKYGAAYQDLLQCGGKGARQYA